MHKIAAGIFFTWLLWGVLACNTVCAQNWVKQYPKSGSLATYSGACLETYDKGFIFIFSNAFVSGNNYTGSNIGLIKTDVNGKILWRRTICRAKQYAGTGIGSAAATSDGGLVLAGFMVANDVLGDVADTANDNFLMKIDACGNMVWSKIYRLHLNSVSGPVAVLNNGDIIVSSQISFGYGTLYNIFNNWTYCTDPKGNIKWEHFNHYESDNIFIDKDENIMETAITYLPYPGTPQIAWDFGELAQLSASGQEVWSSVYGISNHIPCINTASLQTKDGGYISCGVDRGDIDSLFIIKSSASGQVQWTKVIPDDTLEANPYNVARINDSLFVLVALMGVDGFGNGGHLFLYKINDKGFVLKQMVLPFAARSYYSFQVKPTQDGKFIMSGDVLYADNSTGVLAVKFNSDLNLDTIYNNDTNVYDYLCGSKIAARDSIFLGTDTVYITIPYPVADSSAQPGSFLLYPNPAQNSLVQVHCLAGDSNASLTMYDILGRRIRQYNFVPGPTGHTDIDLHHAAAGCYIMVLIQEGKQYVQKLIVE